MHSWELTVTKDSKAVVSKAGQLQDDKFAALVTKDIALPLAKVNMSVGESLDYGSLRVSASVTLMCDQNEAAINRAAELGFTKALELMQDGFSLYGMKAGPTNAG